jgi:predicted CopG family antitoxin
METSTIAVTNDVKARIREFGNKGETYSEILLKLVESARERQLHDLLFNEENTITIESALEKAKKKWQK